VLHRYDWSESSLILEVFTRHHGRIALVAKGAKRPSSNFRPILLPLQPLRLSFGGDAEIRTLKGAEWVGGHVMPTGDALLSGYYLNELLLTLLARDDPHPALFDIYAQVTAVMASEPASACSSFSPTAFHSLRLFRTRRPSSMSSQPTRMSAMYPRVAPTTPITAADAGALPAASISWYFAQDRTAAPSSAMVSALSGGYGVWIAVGLAVLAMGFVLSRVIEEI
jgi:DNA repair protein RecO (recombination protein O)